MWILLAALASADTPSQPANPGLDAIRAAATAADLSWPMPGVHVVVDKSDRKLSLYSGEVLVIRYNVGLGSAPVGDKTQQGDQRTPTGQFTVVTRNPQSRFTLFLGLSYPNAEDAKRGLAQGLIRQDQHDKIVAASASGKQPPWNTTLGGAIGLHGMGGGSDWTLGCVAVDDEHIRALWQVLPYGTPVEIRE